MNLKPGDIILVPFPFTDLSSTKTRPALVLHYNNKTKDIIILAITSQKRGYQEHPINNDDLRKGVLPLRSFVRQDKVTTLHSKLVRKNVASLKEPSLNKIINLFKKQF